VKLRRLRQMGVAEIACRGRQEAFKWLERTGVGVRGRGLAASAGHDLTAFDPGKFFAGAVSAETPGLVAARMPDVRDRAVALADAARRGRFHLLGYPTLSFGEPIDWHLDPISGVRAPLVPWSRLDPLDRARVGDSKVVWELNRHQWLVALAQAYRLTGDESYCEAFVGYVRQWIEANPRGQGINWASSLEVALRLISWSWALFLFRVSTRLSPAVVAALAEGIGAHAAHVERYLSHYFSPNTHLTGEALGLLYAGVVLPECRRARRWRRQGMRILIEQSDRHILPDGVYFEQSTCYQRYTAEIYLHAMILAARNGLGFPPRVTTRVQALLDFLLWVRHPDGSMPMLGDADGGWLLPLTTRAPDDLRGVFSTAAAWFGRPDYAWAAGGRPAPETLWLLGRPGLEAFEALEASAPAGAPSRLFAIGGHAVMRTSWTSDAHQLIFDVGPLGDFGHGHADLLSVQCAVSGAPCLVDAGTYCYTADPGWRDFFRSTAAHSSVTLDGLSQAVPAGPFGWQARPRARVRRWQSTEALDFVDAEHTAYRRLADPVVHRRRILFVKPRYWVVVDDLEGAAEHRLDLRFQFAPMEVSVDPTLWARASRPDGRGLLVRPLCTVPLKADVREGEFDPPAGWVSPDYGQRRPAPMLVYSAVTRLPIRIVTLLLPVEDVSVPTPGVSLLREGSAPVGLAFEETREHVRFGDELVSISVKPVTDDR
jgi:hypothetical protein